LPPPDTRHARSVVAFVDFAGPVGSTETAAHCGIPLSMAAWLLEDMRERGYLKRDAVQIMRYQSRHRWNPDDGVGGARSGPGTPPRRFHDQPLFTDSEPVERILRKPK
jgi:hypothetical protein